MHLSMPLLALVALEPHVMAGLIEILALLEPRQRVRGFDRAISM